MRGSGRRACPLQFAGWTVVRPAQLRVVLARLPAAAEFELHSPRDVIRPRRMCVGNRRSQSSPKM